MTSIALMTTVTWSPSLRPSRSRDASVIAAVTVPGSTLTAISVEWTQSCRGIFFGLPAPTMISSLLCAKIFGVPDASPAAPRNRAAAGNGLRFLSCLVRTAGTG